MFKQSIGIAEHTNNNLIDLAKVSGFEGPHFFDGANFKNADIRQLDLSKYEMRGVDISGALSDAETILPDHCLPDLVTTVTAINKETGRFLSGKRDRLDFNVKLYAIRSFFPISLEEISALCQPGNFRPNQASAVGDVLYNVTIDSVLNQSAREYSSWLDLNVPPGPEKEIISEYRMASCVYFKLILTSYLGVLARSGSLRETRNRFRLTNEECHEGLPFLANRIRERLLFADITELAHENIHHLAGAIVELELAKVPIILRLAIAPPKESVRL